MTNRTPFSNPSARRSIRALWHGSTCALVAPLVLEGLCALVSVTSAQAAGDFRDEHKVVVSGTCNHSVVPDRGSIVLTAEIQDPDLKVATRKATEAYERARAAIQKLSLKDAELGTVEYNVQQQREWEKGKSVFKGYTARIGLKVATSEIQRLGDVIAIASREGLRDVGQLITYLSDEKQMQERFGCLQAAAEDAKSKADKLAHSLGAKLGSTIQILEAPQAQLPRDPMPMAAMSLSESEGGRSTPRPSLEAGRQNISVMVQVSFALQ